MIESLMSGPVLQLVAGRVHRNGKIIHDVGGLARY